MLGQKFTSRAAASEAAAQAIAALVMRRLEGQYKASLVVAGGTTPRQCYEVLTNLKLDWPNVSIVLGDERWVPPDHEDSNERLVRETLLKGRAAAAAMLSMYRPGSDIVERSAEINAELRQLPFPFACALLGMGEDGHFASLFPDAENLPAALDPDNLNLCLPIETAASPHPRVTLTLSALSRSDQIVLLLFGDRKRAVLEAAMSPGSDLPVSRLLLQKRAPVNIFWAP